MDAVRATSVYRFFHTAEDEIFALRGVELVVAKGEFVAVTGPSGSGKSTLLACIAGLDDPDGGSVDIAGQRITRRPERVKARIRATSMGIVLQSGNLFTHLNVAENIRLQRHLAGLATNMEIDSLLGSVELTHRARALPQTLSGGEAARAALAVALAANPPILICDEPTGEIDAATESSILATLRMQQERGAAVLVATHSAALAGRADRVLRLSDGEFE